MLRDLFHHSKITVQCNAVSGKHDTTNNLNKFMTKTSCFFCPRTARPFFSKSKIPWYTDTVTIDGPQKMCLELWKVSNANTYFVSLTFFFFYWFAGSVWTPRYKNKFASKTDNNQKTWFDNHCKARDIKRTNIFFLARKAATN